MARTREELMKAIEVLGPLETEKKQECLEILERTKDHDDYLELIKRAKNSAEIRSDIVDMNLVLAKRKYDYIEFLKTDAGKKCEAFEQRLKRCIEDYRNAKSEAEEAEVDSRFTAVFAEIDAMSAKERTAIKEYLKGYGGTFAAIISDKHGMRWHRSVLKRTLILDEKRLYLSAPNKKFGKPLFDEDILKGRALEITKQASNMTYSHLSSKYPSLSNRLSKGSKQQPIPIFASTSKEAIEEFVKAYGEKVPAYVRSEAVNVFVVESCPAMYDEEKGRLIFNLGEISKGRTRAEAEFYLLQTAIHEYLHSLGGLPSQSLRWINEGIVERISYDVCESTGQKLIRTESGYAPYMGALKWLNDLGVENKIQETAYFTRNPQLLIDEMKKIGMTPTEIDLLLEYGSRININDNLQTDLHAFTEYAKKISRRIHGENEESQDAYGQAMQLGGIYEKRDLTHIQDSKDIDNYITGVFGETSEKTMAQIKGAAEYSQKISGIKTPSPQKIAEAIENKLLICRHESHAIPSAEVFLEIFLQREMDYINNLRFGVQNKRNEPFEFRNAQEIMKKIGLDASLQDCALLAEKAVGYLWWKNIHDPSVAQVMDVLLKGMESPGSGKTLIEKIANSIDLQGSLLATKTIDEMHEIYQKQSSRSNLVAYFKNVNYRIDDYVVDSGMRLMQLLGEIVYSGDYITVHPELGIVRTGNDGLILDQHVGNRVGGSYDLKMYTSNPFVKVMPYLGK